MTKRSNTNNLRLMLNKDWVSNWFSEKSQYPIFLQNDLIIYKYFFWHYYFKESLLKMRIIRFSRKIILFFLISYDRKIMLKDFKLNLNTFLFKAKNIFLVLYKNKFFKSNSFYIAKKIATLIENKVRFRSTVVKKLLNDAKLVKSLLVVCKGRINGVEMAKKDFLVKGSIPFQKFHVKLNFSQVIANTLKGSVIVKVWSRFLE
uniref:Ribosomal protein S3 n=1 Tax=Rhodomonas salina TaxID=3034 RepID=Q9G8W8_RHDSA|nr:ribosomal protein S3 [Rhodomonas salina]AAG17729.1 ribosomal protein S3 [Rhodomonas salina]